MNINAKHIESFGGLVAAEIELNTSDLPDVQETEVTAYLFNGFGVAEYCDQYIALNYPLVADAMGDVQMKRTINQKRYGYRVPDDFKVTVDDVAICYGEASLVSKEEYIDLLITGLWENAKKVLKGSTISLSEYNAKLNEVTKAPCKHLHIYKDQSEFLKELDGKVYAVCDDTGTFVCDVLEADLLRLEQEKCVADPSGDNQISNMQLSNPLQRNYLYSQRIEIIILRHQKRNQNK